MSAAATDYVVDLPLDQWCERITAALPKATGSPAFTAATVVMLPTYMACWSAVQSSAACGH